MQLNEGLLKQTVRLRDLGRCQNCPGLLKDNCGHQFPPSVSTGEDNQMRFQGALLVHLAWMEEVQAASVGQRLLGTGSGALPEKAVLKPTQEIRQLEDRK